MIVVSGTVEIDPADLERALEAGRTAAAESRAEPGCRTYAFYQDIEAPARLRVFEEWDDGAALDRHFQTPHFQAFGAVLRSLRILSRDIVRYEVTGATPV